MVGTVYERVCANENCQKSFTTTDERKFTCCRQCSKARERQRMKEVRLCNASKERATKACETCGKEFVQKTKQQKYCCKECNPGNMRVKPTVKACKRCGKEFEGTGKRRYCSLECSYLANLEQARGIDKKRRLSKNEPQQKPKVKKPTGSRALALRQGILVTGKTDLQIAEEARAAGMSTGKYKAMLQMQYEKEMGIGMYASK